LQRGGGEAPPPPLIYSRRGFNTLPDLRSALCPGVVDCFLAEEFLAPLGISAYRLSKDIHIPATRASEILKGNRRITVNTAPRLSKYLIVFIDFYNLFGLVNPNTLISFPGIDYPYLLDSPRPDNMAKIQTHDEV
jgi:addiction module HigA family antidote